MCLCLRAFTYKTTTPVRFKNNFKIHVHGIFSVLDSSELLQYETKICVQLVSKFQTDSP